MTVVIDYLSDDITTIKSKLSKIQERYFDPYSISITTSTNKQVFFSDYLNDFNAKLLGKKNGLIDGLNISLIENTSYYYKISIQPGSAIVDKVIIKFLDEVHLIIPKTGDYILDSSNPVLMIYIDYKYVKTYPYNVATFKISRQDKIPSDISGNPFVPIGFLYDDGTNIELYPESDNQFYTDWFEKFLNNPVISSDAYISSIISTNFYPTPRKINNNDLSSKIEDIYNKITEFYAIFAQDILELKKDISLINQYIYKTSASKNKIILKDKKTDKLYELTIENGELYIEEV